MRTLLLSLIAAVALSSPAVVSAAAPKAPTCDGLTATVVGTRVDDTLTGTTGDDVIVGLGGDDVIVGDLGSDRICGGTGDDTLSGHAGTDYLFGEQGNDLLDGGVGGCCDPVANSGDDVLSGGTGNDELHAADFPTTGNTMHGDQGKDVLYAWSGGAAYGDQGKDELFQYAGTAALDGGNGADTLTNQDDPSADVVTLVGGRGSDTLVNEDTTGTTDMQGGLGSEPARPGRPSPTAKPEGTAPRTQPGRHHVDRLRPSQDRPARSRAATTSADARRPDSIAPCIYPAYDEGCSPAKWIRHSARPQVWKLLSISWGLGGPRRRLPTRRGATTSRRPCRSSHAWGPRPAGRSAVPGRHAPTGAWPPRARRARSGPGGRPG